MKTIEEYLVEYKQEESVALDNKTSIFIQHLDIFSSIFKESLYVWDIVQKQFCYIKPDDLFLCGFSTEEALKEGSNFYSKIIYPDDLCLWTTMQNAVLSYLKDSNKKRNDIDYFSCTIRMHRIYSFFPQRSMPQMVYNRMKYVRIDDKIRYLICSIGSSTSKEAGSLRMYNKDRLTYEEYNLTTRHWKQKTIELLTERERTILILAGQGKNSRDIADHLCKGHNTIRNQIKTLFYKLNVHSMQEAIELACCHRLIYPKHVELQCKTDKKE